MPRGMKPKNSMTISEFARLGGLARAARLSAARRQEISRQGTEAKRVKAEAVKKGP